MTTCQTTTCDKPTRDDAYTCDDCLDDFAKVLGNVTWIDAELETTITKQRAATSGGAPSAEVALPYNAKASELAGELRLALVNLVRLCIEEGVRSRDHRDREPGNTLVAMSRWLLWRVDGLAFNDMAPEFIRAATEAIRACERIIDLPPDRSYAGPCPECKRDLYHRPDAAEVNCHGCGQRWDVAEVTVWMQDRIRDHMDGLLVTAREGSTLLSRAGIETTQRAIDKWHERGLLLEAGHVAPEGGGRPRRLYRWDDVLALAARNQRAS